MSVDKLTRQTQKGEKKEGEKSGKILFTKLSRKKTKRLNRKRFKVQKQDKVKMKKLNKRGVRGMDRMYGSMALM